MSKKISTFLLVAAVLGSILGSCALPAYANIYSIDGSLADWGVTPFVGWQPNSPTANYIEEDWGETSYPGYIGTGIRPGGGEIYDAEALYFDDDPNYLYFAMVSSFPLAGCYGIFAGDLAIDFTGAAGNDYDYGLKIIGMTSAEYGASQRQVILNADWNDRGSKKIPANMLNGTGTLAGLADLYYWDAESLYNEPGTSLHTYILEGRIDRSIFGDYAKQGNKVNLHWTMNCLNDVIDLTGDINSTTVPEPATVSLLGLGLLGLLGYKKR
jgi:hypothetical protein